MDASEDMPVSQTITGATAHADAGEGVGTPTVLMRTRLLGQWAEIAKEHLAGAERARADLTQQLASGEPREAIGRELRESMIAVSASAHAIEALYGEVVEVARERGLELVDSAQVAAWKAHRTPRHARIFETLKRVYQLDEDFGHEVAWLFKTARDRAIHPETRFEQTTLHPLGFDTSPAYVLFVIESARRAVAVLEDAMSAATDRPRPGWDNWTVPHLGIADG
jgi:hypothetical protein